MSYPGDVFREINARLAKLEVGMNEARAQAFEEAIRLIDVNAKSDHDTWLCRRLREMQEKSADVRNQSGGAEHPQPPQEEKQ